MTPSLIFDIIVIVALLVSAIIAFLRGFIREVLTIFGVVGGLAAAYAGGPLIAPLVRGWLGVNDGGETKKLFDILPYPILADIIAYGSIFIIVVIILSIISHLLAGWAKKIGLGAVDRTFGVIFGIARGVVLLALLYLPFYMMFEEENRKELFGESRTRFYVESTAAFMADLMPDSMNAHIQQTYETGTKATRAKLQELDVLRQDEKAAPEGTENDPDNGYNNKERARLDQLFERNLNE